ncbi:hypothetical protein ACFQPG_03210 [Sphingomonas sp. GCM10030256]|uniref:hypothetical protein n=1 Tax=Sphingomonas sp. GCM10030256 TaxID=3273427 RepID=UPI00360A148E
MRVVLALTLLLAGCAGPSWKSEPGLPGDLARHDQGDLSGVWRSARLTVTIDQQIGTFAAQSGCTISGGVLHHIEGGRFHLWRYESGFASDRCGPWRNGPELAPFDGAEVVLMGVGNRLRATGPGRSAELWRDGA